MLDDTKVPAADVPAQPVRASSGGLLRERVIEVQHYTDRLFSFRTTRAPSFRFQSGQFAMIGIMSEGKPLLRAYSMTSAVYDEYLEFFSIKVPNGPLTSRLQHIKVGDEILVNAKPTGTLVMSNLRPGKRLWLLSTGTGFAPFASIVRDHETYEPFEQVIAVEGCREVAELEFATRVIMGVRQHECLKEIIGDKLHYYATVTRESFHRMGRIPELIKSGKIFRDLQLPAMTHEDDRVMLCGSPGMLADTKALLLSMGFSEGSSGEPGEFVIEKAFVEK